MVITDIESATMLYRWDNGMTTAADEKRIREMIRVDDARAEAKQVRVKLTENGFLDWYVGIVLEENYDGDSWTMEIDQGFGNKDPEAKIRLYGVNTPEIRGVPQAEKDRGYEARDWVRSIVYGKLVLLYSHRQKDTGEPEDGKYGRYLFQLICQEPESGEWFNLNQALVETGRSELQTYGEEFAGWAPVPWAK